MKLPSFILLFALCVPVFAETPAAAKPAEEKDASAEKKADETPADAAWAKVAGLLNGPKKQPKSQEEAKEIFTTFLKDFDDAAATFSKDYPKDARRWQVELMEVRLSNLRENIQNKPSDPAATEKRLAGILAAEDADEKTKTVASFIQVMNASDDEAKFKTLADAHIAKYPKFEGNEQLQQQLKAAEAMAAVKSAPLEMKFTATDGKEVDVAALRGKVVLVDFWATWCGPCVQEIPNVLKTYESLHGKGFEILGISFDQDKDKLEAMTKEKKMPWAQYFDGKGWSNEFGKKYGITSIPAMWLVNKKGFVVDTNARENLEEKVLKLLEEK